MQNKMAACCYFDLRLSHGLLSLGEVLHIFVSPIQVYERRPGLVIQTFLCRHFIMIPGNVLSEKPKLGVISSLQDNMIHEESEHATVFWIL